MHLTVSLNPEKVPTKWRRSVLFGVIVVADLAIAIAFSIRFSVDIPTHHLDGAFQTASGLFRLADGQWPGKHFFSYLGLGPLFILYPIFHIAGADISASQFSASLMTLLSGAFSVGIVAALISKRNRMEWAFVSSTVFLLGAGLLIPEGIAKLLLMIPGSSLRSLRTFAPYLFLPAAFFLFRTLTLSKACIATGALAGMAPFWSNDYGIPTAGLLLVWTTLQCWQTRSQFIPMMTRSIAVGFISFAGLGFLATHGALDALLTYWYVDVRRDQWWYFGPLTPFSRIYNLFDVLIVLVVDTLGFIFVLVGIGFVYWRDPSDYNRLLLFLGLALCGGGLLSAIGGHREVGYFSGLIRWGLVVVVILGLQSIPRRIVRRLFPFVSDDDTLLALHGRGLHVFAGATAATAIALIFYATQLRVEAEDDPMRMFVPALGGYLPVEYQPHLNAILLEKSAVVEEYWGLWSGITHQHSPVRTDSVIHALGKERNAFAEMMATHPEIVVTTPHTYAPEFQSWSISANWWFYQSLLRGYQETKTSPSTLVWRKRDGVIATWLSVPCTVTGSSFKLDATFGTGYFEIALEVQIPNWSPRRELVVVKNNINQVAGANGYFSIDPRAATHRFPVHVKSVGDEFDLKRLPDSPSLTDAKITECNALKIPLASDEVMPALGFDGKRRRAS